MWRLVIKACILLAVTTHVNTQYSDFFSSLNAFLQPFATTKRHDVTKRPEVRHKHTNKHKHDETIHFQNDEVKDLNSHSSKRKSSQTTVRPRPKSVNSNKISGSRSSGVIRSISDSRDPYNDVNRETNDDRGNNWNYGTTNNNRQEDYGTNNQWNHRTTTNPLLNRPGVKPAVVDESRPPITNKPVTVRPVYDIPFNTGTYRPVNTRPYDDDRQSFNSQPANTRPPFEIERPRPGTTIRPGSTNRPVTSRPGTEDPDIEIGPDEDDMSETEKRRYYNICEQKCTEYKASNTRKVVALPLATDQRAEFNVTSCTRAKVPLIIGGQVVEINQFPHMALIGWRKLQGGGYSWKCGGSLVSERHILTAGHCTYFDKDDQIVSGAPQAVQLGSSHMDGRDGTVVSIGSIIRHPKYKLRRSYYDVAVIKLVTTVRFSARISPACLGVPPPVGEPIIATGWGKTEFGGDHSVELRSVSLPIWDIKECREIWGTSRKLPQGPMANNQICAGERKGAKDTCQGDSGGPAQIQDGCTWRVVAVTSVGRSCGAPDTPALYAKIPRAFVGSVLYGGTGNNGGGTGNNGGGTGNNGGGNGGNSWGTTNSNGGPNRGTDSNVWGTTNSNNGGINSGTSWGTSNNRGSETNSWGNNNNRGTDSNVWGVSNNGGSSNNKGTDSNIWSSNNRDTSNNRGSGNNAWGTNNNRATESTVNNNWNNNNSGTTSNRGNDNNNGGTSSSHYGIGSNIRETTNNNGGTSNRRVDNVRGSTTNNNRNNNRQDSWASGSNKEIVNNNRGTGNNNRGNDNNGRGTDNNGRGTDNNGRGTDNNGRGTDNNGRGTDNNNGGITNNWNNQRVANVRPDLNKEPPKTTTIGYNQQNYNIGQRGYENSPTTQNPNYSAQNYYNGYNSFSGGVPWLT